MKRKIKFQFDYNCTPLWLSCEGDVLVNGDGYFYWDYYTLDGQPEDIREPEERLKGEYELERRVKLIYEIHNRLFDINEFPAGEPYLGFSNEQEKKDFFDACDYVIKRMREIFGDEFTVNEIDERIIKERSEPVC